MILRATDKFSSCVKIVTPEGAELKNINSIDLETMYGMEVVEGKWKGVDLRLCTIIIKPLCNTSTKKI